MHTHSCCSVSHKGMFAARRVALQHRCNIEAGATSQLYMCSTLLASLLAACATRQQNGGLVLHLLAFRSTVWVLQAKRDHTSAHRTCIQGCRLWQQQQ